MHTTFVSGNWLVRTGAEDAFIEAWSAFLDWTSRQAPGLLWVALLHDAGDGRRFISVAEWDSPEHRDSWRANPDFAAHLGACRALCDEFRAGDYTLAAAIGQLTRRS